ncbi:hypothetical protein [Sphingomonas colocasiae]|uniref:DUF1398 domain-containing protein n=1 Tax=Sphingomonas colocasiae TaxID=1848973 RepID=A0ABS7PSB5_9SPHN|nr:hypothetical protein [Sphingomonas colocasiae]MBY8823277.1 hypothetical protein [Sphingomonas colocasiae]
MDAQLVAVALRCLEAAHDGSMDFPAIIDTLMRAGFEGYEVNYRTGRQTVYLPDGDSAVLAIHPYAGPVQPDLRVGKLAELVRWAQSGDPSYSYAAFSEAAKQAGCAGYMVSFPGRRVLYYGRTGEVHTEFFP